MPQRYVDYFEFKATGDPVGLRELLLPPLSRPLSYLEEFKLGAESIRILSSNEFLLTIWQGK